MSVQGVYYSIGQYTRFYSAGQVLITSVLSPEISLMGNNTCSNLSLSGYHSPTFGSLLESCDDLNIIMVFNVPYQENLNFLKPKL